MYLQITTKCNMKCEHCCFKCEPGKGEHMSMEVFNAAMDLVSQYEDFLTIGGGEPTLHPNFETILLECIAVSGDEYKRPFIVTNGTSRKRSLMLHKLSKAKVIDAHLSTDGYHDYDMVDSDVRDAFPCDDWNIDRGSGPIATGRWKETQEVEEDMDKCVCSTPLIQPDGNIRYCGCLDAPIIGNVFDGIEWPEYECYKETLCDE